MKTQGLFLQHERVDDIPLLLGVLQQLRLPEIMEQHLGSHHLHQGISNGLLATAWIAFILSEANHYKVSVQDWACSHQHTLQTLLGTALRPVEFSDDRLGIILRRLHDADWSGLETNLWEATCQVYEITCDCIRLDATTTCGYHEITADGIMQLGHSKDHRPDLPQLKLMAAVAQPTSQCIACDIVAGNCADDPLYLPLIERARQLIKRSGMLYSGDCKMAALETRADIVQHKDFYLVPLPKTGETAQLFETWIDRGLAGTDVQLHQFTKVDDKQKPFVFARGYEFERDCTCQLHGKAVVWTERVQVIQSMLLAERQRDNLDKRLAQAEAVLNTLTPPVGRGRRQIKDEEDLLECVRKVLDKFDVTDLLHVHWERQETVTERHKGRGRPGVRSETHTEVKIRYQITAVTQRYAAIERAKQYFGWRVQVTNLPARRCGLEEAVLLYNGGWSVERDWHLLKDRPLGIQPLYVREDEQIIGLTRLLTIAMRVLTLIEIAVRGNLQKSKEELSGLYEGQPSRKTATPTAVRMLKTIVRMGITITQVTTVTSAWWQLTPLAPLVLRILELLHLSPEIYFCLANGTG